MTTTWTIGFDYKTNFVFLIVFEWCLVGIFSCVRLWLENIGCSWMLDVHQFLSMTLSTKGQAILTFEGKNFNHKNIQKKKYFFFPLCYCALLLRNRNALCHTSKSSWQQTAQHLCSGDLFLYSVVQNLVLYVKIHRLAQSKCSQM